MKGRKGQTSAEFLLVLLIVLIFLQMYIQPTVDTATDALEDTKRVGMLRVAGEKLANGINELAILSGDGRKTVHVLLPPESKLEGFRLTPQIGGEVTLKTRYPTDEIIFPSARCLARNIILPGPDGDLTLRISFLDCETHIDLLTIVPFRIDNDSLTDIEAFTVQIQKTDGGIDVTVVE